MAGDPPPRIIVRARAVALPPGAGVFRCAREGEVVAIERRGHAGGWRVAVPADAFLEAGGNPFDFVRAMQSIEPPAAEGDADLEVAPSPRREVQIALRWTSGFLAQWWLLGQRLLVGTEPGFAALRGTEQQCADALEGICFATPRARRLPEGALFDFSEDPGDALFRRAQDGLWIVDAEKLRVVGSVPQDEVGAYESWVLMSMLDPGMEFVAGSRDAAFEAAQWFDGQRAGFDGEGAGLAAADRKLAAALRSVLEANEELVEQRLESLGGPEELRAVAAAFAEELQARRRRRGRAGVGED